MKVQKSYSVAFCGVMAALAISLGYLEYLIPFSVGIYGIKLGLANLAILVLLYLTDTKRALAVHMIRIIVCGILFGNAVAFAYSTVGGVLSFAAMAILKKAKNSHRSGSVFSEESCIISRKWESQSYLSIP